LNMFDTSKCFGACNKIFISTRWKKWWIRLL
jgi:hypothetical protein